MIGVRSKYRIKMKDSLKMRMSFLVPIFLLLASFGVYLHTLCATVPSYREKENLKKCL